MVVVVPQARRRAVFDEAHRGVLAGHFNARKVARVLEKRVFWEGMKRDIAKWVKGCRECFLANPWQTLCPSLKPMMASKPFELVCVDLLEMGMSVSGMKYVVVLVDHFSKWLGAYALPDKTAATVATAIYQRWICENGRWPKQLHSDLGAEFVNQAMEELARAAGIKRTTTKGYDSRANGACERAIGTLQRILKKKVDRPDYWDTWLPNAVYAYNVTPHEGTGESPFFLLHGFDPFIPSEVIPESAVSAYQLDWDDYKTELLRGMQLIREKVNEFAEKYRNRMKNYFDGKHGVAERRLPKVGTRVFMRLPCEKRRTRYPKLAIEWDGPFRVIEISNNSALITRIGTEEEPLRIQMDLLRVCPEEIGDDPVRGRTGRRQRRRENKGVRSAGTAVRISEDQWSCLFRNATEELAAGRVDGTRTAMIVPAVLRVLKKAKRWQRTEVFYYWDFQDLHAGRTFMFDRRIKDVILVLPPAETGVGSWTALVDAVAVWLGAGGRVFLIAGPRTGDDTAWMRVTTQAREFLEKHLKPASHAQICDMLPRGMDVVDMNAPCAVLGIIENEELTVALKRACAFYMACRKQLSPWTQMEALPEVPRRRPPSVDKYPGIRSGRIGKRRCRSPPASCPLRVRH